MQKLRMYEDGKIPLGKQRGCNRRDGRRDSIREKGQDSTKLSAPSVQEPTDNH